MRSPMDMLLDKVNWKCTRCGAKSGTCGCWVKNIKLVCPECRRTKMICREENDPKGTATVRVQCDKCDDGSKVEVLYFDKRGKMLNGIQD